MRIEKAFFDRLLWETDPIEAVATLAQFWTARARPSEVKFGLALPEYRVSLCLIYSGEVGNGGHAQYFANRGVMRASDTVDSLAHVGLGPLAAVLRKAVPAAADADALTSFKPASVPVLEQWARLDGEAFRLLANVDPVLLEYIRNNADDILVPERDVV